MRDTRAFVDTLADRAVTTYYADPRAGWTSFYLLYRPSTETQDGALAFVPEGENPPGWVLADPRAQRGGTDRNQLFNHVRSLAYRLPILCPID